MNTGVREFNTSLALGWKHGEWSVEGLFSRYENKTGLLPSGHLRSREGMAELLRRGMPDIFRPFSRSISNPYHHVVHYLGKVKGSWENDHLGRLHGLRPHMYHFAYTDADDSGEDLMTTGYLMDTAIQAGLTSTLVEMKQLGLDRETARFTDGKNRHLEAIFKLYPWEEMMFEEFGPAICALKPDYWFQPAWTMFLSTKALSAALWHLYPNHPNPLLRIL